jgi:hypothetical protein
VSGPECDLASVRSQRRSNTRRGPEPRAGQIEIPNIEGCRMAPEALRVSRIRPGFPEGPAGEKKEKRASGLCGAGSNPLRVSQERSGAAAGAVSGRERAGKSLHLRRHEVPDRISTHRALRKRSLHFLGSKRGKPPCYAPVLFLPRSPSESDKMPDG